LAAETGTFEAKLHWLKGADPQFKTQEPLDRLVALLREAQFWVSKAGQTVKARSPLPPFTTSTLQQAASKGLGLSPEKTMQLAQTLYEAGRITYMRTDGVSVAREAQAAAREHIQVHYGADYLPPEPPTYTVKTAKAQEAHEAIRPTDVSYLPAEVDGDGAALYALVWKRFVASQMAAALYTVTDAIISAGKAVGQPFPLEFRAQGRRLLFDGFLKVYEEPNDEGEEGTEENTTLPPLKEGDLLKLVEPLVRQHQTRAPPATPRRRWYSRWNSAVSDAPQPMPAW
jgi:DNA topoisomerase-1